MIKMQSENSPEIMLKQINKGYELLDKIFYQLSNNHNLDEDHFRYSIDHLDDIITHLNWINTYLDITETNNE